MCRIGNLKNEGKNIMLKTSFGNIRMFLDKKEVEFNFSKIQNSKAFLENMNLENEVQTWLAVSYVIG